MRHVKYAFLAIVAACLITVSLANREIVALRLLPREIAELTGLDAGIELPLFLVIFAGIVAGLAIGFVWEWMREHRYRHETARAKRELSRLRARERKDSEDDVLALLENDGKAR